MADYTFYVKVANSKFVLDSVSQATIALGHGITYRFDQSDSSNSGHPLVFSTTSDGTHNSGSAYTTGVTTTGTAGSSGAYVDIAVTSSTPASLYYYCSNHSGMGSAVITTGNTHVTTNNLGLLLPILADATDQWGSHINQSLRKIEDTFGANADVYTYNITGDTTAITGSATAGGTLAFNDGQHIEVYLNGVKLVGNLSSGNDYTLNASTDTITLASNAVNGDVVNVVVFKTFQFADAVPASTGGTFSGDVTVPNLIIGDGGNIGSASDTDALTIDSSGNVGIGQANPTKNLEILGTAPEIRAYGNSNSGAFSSYGSFNGSDLFVGIENSSGGLSKGSGAYGRFIHSTGAYPLSIYTNGTERIQVKSGGDVEVKTGNVVIGTAGKGITFQDTYATNDSSTANEAYTLDSYETGTWSNTTISSTSNVSFSTPIQTGGYVKIGRQVTLWWSNTTGSISSAGTLTKATVNSLPFLPDRNACGALYDGYREMSGVSLAGANNNYITMWYDESVVDFTGTVHFNFTITYETDA